MQKFILSLIQSLILIFTFNLITSLSYAENCVDKECEALRFCYKTSKKFYTQNGSPSDTHRSFNMREYLPAGNPLKGRTAQDVRGVFEVDKLVYVGTGSYHSGHFIDLIVVNPVACDNIQIINIYSE